MRLIDADALFNDLKKSARDAREWREETQDEEIKIRAEQALGTLIEAEPERRGRWIPTKLKGYYECTACRYEHTSNPAQRFCSYCGARMDGGEQNVLDL